MPANPKYLTSSRWQRFAKISAGFLGGLTLSLCAHMALAAWFKRPEVVMSSAFTGFLLWGVLLMLAFLGRNGWKVWAIYLLLSIVFAGIGYAGIILQP